MTTANQTTPQTVKLLPSKSTRKKKRLARIADRRIEGSFILLPTELLRHKQVHAMSVHAKALLIALIAQLRIGDEGPKNNGDLAITYSMMHRDYGFLSPSTLNKAKKELLENLVIVETRKGGRHKCSLFALTCFAINECDGKIDCMPTSVPPCVWRGLRIEPRIRIATTPKDSKLGSRRYKGTLVEQVVLSQSQSSQIH